ncbi:MAG TPA: hypothetical protein VN855_00250 [Candidatus Acidoferrum sp.]|nr:hypothetical protein [Candidatus Acidoferrum sp.]
MLEKLKAFWAKINSDVADLWQKDKAFVLLFGVLILIVKFREILISLIVANSKHLFDKAQKESDALQTQENTDNATAEKLEEDAKKLSDSNTPVDDNWNRK